MMKCKLYIFASTYARFPAFRSATQRNVTQEFSRKKVLRTFWRNRRRRNSACGFCGAPQANRNDLIFRNDGGQLYQSQLRLRSANAAVRLRCVTESCKTRIRPTYQWRRWPKLQIRETTFFSCQRRSYSKHIDKTTHFDILYRHTWRIL